MIYFQSGGLTSEVRRYYTLSGNRVGYRCRARGGELKKIACQTGTPRCRFQSVMASRVAAGQDDESALDRGEQVSPKSAAHGVAGHHHLPGHDTLRMSLLAIHFVPSGRRGRKFFQGVLDKGRPRNERTQWSSAPCPCGLDSPQRSHHSHPTRSPSPPYSAVSHGLLAPHAILQIHPNPGRRSSLSGFLTT